MRNDKRLRHETAAWNSGHYHPRNLLASTSGTELVSLTSLFVRVSFVSYRTVGTGSAEWKEAKRR